MRALGVALFSLAVLDVLLGTRRHPWRAVLAVTVATACAAAGGLAVGLSGRVVLLLAISVLVEAPLWILARNAEGRRAAALLGGLVTVLLLRFASSGGAVPAERALFERWATTLPGTLGHYPDRLAYGSGAVAFLVTAANTYVRLLLAAAPKHERPSKTPGGGRLIGSLERLLVFGLAVGGNVAAAALVVSAKGVLRFAEVRAADGDDVDAITEYVLVGSLTSIALALAFVPFAVA